MCNKSNIYSIIYNFLSLFLYYYSLLLLKEAEQNTKRGTITMENKRTTIENKGITTMEKGKIVIDSCNEACDAEGVIYIIETDSC